MSRHRHAREICTSCNVYPTERTCPACQEPVCAVCQDDDGLCPVCSPEGEETEETKGGTER